MGRVQKGDAALRGTFMTFITGGRRGNVGPEKAFQSGSVLITPFTDTSIVANDVTFASNQVPLAAACIRYGNCLGEMV